MRVKHKQQEGTPGTQPPGARLLRFADFELDVATRELRRGAACVPVRRQVFDLLLLLLERRPQTVSREELRQAMGERGTNAANAVARAVLEARRAIGDPQDDPRYIVNVHGVGYRFAGQPAEGPGPVATQPMTPLERTRARLLEAETAYERHNDETLARFHAESALAEAMRHGFNVETGNALCWLAWLAMWSGAVNDAARHVGHALHLAQREDHPLLMARAHTMDAFMRMARGDFDTAMARLTAAHPVLAERGRPVDLYRCEHLLSAVARSLGMADAARQWCLQTQRTAQNGGLHLAWLRAVGAECTLETEAGDQLDQEGCADEARAAWERALAQCDSLLRQSDPAVDPWLHSGTLGSRGTLLGRLRRYAEAREAFVAMERCLDRQPHGDAPPMLDRRVMLHAYRIRIGLLESDHVRAMQEVQAGICLMEARNYRGQWRPALYELGSAVAEHCGQYERALRWSREHMAAHQALQGDRARLMAQAMQTQSQVAALRAELASARSEVQLLESLNADLLQRLHAADPASAGLTRRTPCPH